MGRRDYGLECQTPRRNIKGDIIPPGVITRYKLFSKSASSSQVVHTEAGSVNIMWLIISVFNSPSSWPIAMQFLTNQTQIIPLESRLQLFLWHTSLKSHWIKESAQRPNSPNEQWYRLRDPQKAADAIVILPGSLVSKDRCERLFIWASAN